MFVNLGGPSLITMCRDNPKIMELLKNLHPSDYTFYESTMGEDGSLKFLPGGEAKMEKLLFSIQRALDVGCDICKGNPEHIRLDAIRILNFLREIISALGLQPELNITKLDTDKEKKTKEIWIPDITHPDQGYHITTDEYHESPLGNYYGSLYCFKYKDRYFCGIDNVSTDPECVIEIPRVFYQPFIIALVENNTGCFDIQNIVQRTSIPLKEE